MTYFERITKLTETIPVSLVDFESDRTQARIPTQVSSNFITNKQQGDWAEELIFAAINEASKNYVAVRYGKSDDLIAGDEGFNNFYQEFQDELDTIGKRPDILVFDKSDYNPIIGARYKQTASRHYNRLCQKSYCWIGNSLKCILNRPI
jgi:AccI restriction endonuclease